MTGHEVRAAGTCRSRVGVDALTVVIPVFNESRSIGQVVDDVNAELDRLPIDGRLLILNDGSSDWSEQLERKLLAGHRTTVKSFYPNEGKGAMVDRALSMLETELAVIIDADGEYAARDIERVLEPLQKDEADWSLGSRYGFGRARPRQYLLTYLVNRLVNAWFYLLSGRRFNDLLTGLYAFRVEKVANLRIQEKRFSYTAELMWKVLADRRLRWREIPVSYRFRGYAQGKKIRWWETGTILLALLRYRFARARARSRIDDAE